MRYELNPATQQLSLDSIDLRGTSTHVTLSLCQLQYVVRYIRTAYGVLCQQNLVHADVESAFQVQPLPSAQGVARKLKVGACTCACTDAFALTRLHSSLLWHACTRASGPTRATTASGCTEGRCLATHATHTRFGSKF